MTPDLRFWFDPVCPFAWLTSKWVRQVAAQRDYEVEWRFISLRLLNKDVDYDAHFPAGYDAGHTAGLQLLRVAASVRAGHGPGAVAALYEAYGQQVFEVGPEAAPVPERIEALVEAALTAASLPAVTGTALGDTSWDAQIQEETDEALALTGKDVGTPILQFRPPTGVAFFGPVISRLPSDEQALELWDHVVGLAGFPGFAELKRSLRERPQLPSFGVPAGAAGITEDWHGGSRRTKEERG
jgi:hypothetical protein